ncbi:MAG: sulfotransferase family protein [Thermoplasmatota archaeon]
MAEDLRVDLFCIGAPKCGTTWLAACLDEHPEAAVSDPKETNFYAPRTGFRRAPRPGPTMDQSTYRACFRPATVRADFSVNMLHNGTEVASIVAKDWPHAKLLLVLREPVQRAYSQYWNARRNHPQAKVPSSFLEALDIPEFRYQSEYAAQLVSWSHHFASDRFLFVLDHQLRDDPHAVIRHLYGWLGLDDGFVPPSLERRINAAHATGPLGRAAKQLAAWVERRGGRSVVQRLADTKAWQTLRRLDQRDKPYPPLTPEEALAWWDHLEPDLEQLATTWGVDVAPWRAQAEAWAGAS